MDREQTEKWAKEAGMWSDLYSHWKCSRQQIERFAALVRRAALERAKDACINIGDEQGSIYASGTHDCADAITALIEKEPKP